MLLLFACIVVINIGTSSLQYHTENKANLIFLQIIFRHGARAPIAPFPNDPNSNYRWPDGLEKLTELGKMQHYELGKHIKSMYKGFITSNPNEVSANSSAVDRCRRSALSHLAGLYEPDPEWIFDQSIRWQPIPVSYLPVKEDKCLSYRYKCPRADKENENLMKSYTEETKDKHKDMFEYLTMKSGMEIKDEMSALMLFDTLFAEKTQKLPIPDWAEFYWKDLEEMSDSFFWRFNSPTVQRLRAGPFIAKLSTMMKKKLNGELPEQKVQVYATHDIVVAVLLSALGLSNEKRPPFAATLLVELHEGSLGHKFVRFLYLNSSIPETGQQVSHVLQLEGCAEMCPFKHFLNFVHNKIPKDLESECKV